MRARLSLWRVRSLLHTLAQRADKIVVLERGTIVEIGILAIAIAHTLFLLCFYLTLTIDCYEYYHFTINCTGTTCSNS